MDVIEDAGFGEGFCLGNALKYILRAKHKNNFLEDINPIETRKYYQLILSQDLFKIKNLYNFIFLS